MMQQHTFITDKVKLGKKGQITVPKKIRDEDELQEDDVFIVSHNLSGDLIFKKEIIKTPEDRMLEIIKSIPSFDADKAWKEVEEERKREHR